MGQYLNLMDIKNGKIVQTEFKDCTNFIFQSLTDSAIPTIHNILRNMKEYSMYQHHHQLQHALQIQPQQENDKVLDLSSKRRDSTETRKTTSPSSFEEGSPDTRHSPNNSSSQLLLHHHINIPKPPFTPEHAVQFHYKYEQTSPTTTSLIKTAPLRPSHELFERFEGTPIMRKQENHSPQHETKCLSPQFYHTRPSISDQHADDSNDLPTITSNISSSSSTTSSQKSPSSTISNRAMMVVGRDGKLSRPFKAFPRDPLSLAAAASILDSSSDEKYSAFRKRALEHIHAANGGNPVINNPKMRRTTTRSTSQEPNNNEAAYESFHEKIQNQKSPSSSNEKDEAYYERRKKNNAAAKKSRDRRRIKEDEIAIRAAFLQKENCELKYENVALKNENAMLQKQLAIFHSGLTSN